MRVPVVVSVGVAAVLAACVAGCDPCAGVASCDPGPRLAIEGTIIDRFSGLGVPNVRIDVVRTGGVVLDSDSLAEVTDDHGHWQISVRAAAAGDAIVDINVRTPSTPPYRATGMQLSTSARIGDGHVLPPWAPDPIFEYALELHYRANDAFAVNVPIEFHRVDGIHYYITDEDEVFQQTSDGAGRVALFDVVVHAIGLGDLVGNVIAHLPPPLAPDTILLRLSATPLLHPVPVILIEQVGPSS